MLNQNHVLYKTFFVIYRIVLEPNRAVGGLPVLTLKFYKRRILTDQKQSKKMDQKHFALNNKTTPMYIKLLMHMYFLMSQLVILLKLISANLNCYYGSRFHFWETLI